VKVISFTGKGKAFCTGADLKERFYFSDRKVMKRIEHAKRVFKLIEDISIPTIAAINGFALGGGLEMALACDFRVMSMSASIGLTECKLGIIPGAGGTQRLTRIVGPSQAKKIIYSCEFLSAESALKNLVVDYVTNDILEGIYFFADKLFKAAPLSLKAAKKSINNNHLPTNEGLNLETYLYKTIISTRDKQEGLIAFKEKRSPLFTGY
jgi:enoyl-CoA hydratase/carnithine racemase